METQKIINWVLGGIVVIVLGVFMFGHSKSLGDATVSNYPTWYYNGIVIGPSNSLLNNIVKGTCTLSSVTSIATSSSGAFTCTATGAQVGDTILITNPDLTTASNSRGFNIVAAGVSATDTIKLIIANQSGVAATPATASTTAIPYINIR